MKKVLMVISTMVAALVFSTGVYAEEIKGTVTTMGANTGSVSDATESDVVTTTVSYTELNLNFAEANPDIDRNVNGWWVGVLVTAPNSIDGAEAAQKAVYGSADYVKDGEFIKAGKSFYTYKDGEWNIQLWKRVDKEQLEDAENPYELMNYYFDWNGDNKVDQRIIIKIDPTNVNFKTPQDSGIDTEYVNVIIGKRTFSLPKGTTLKSLLETSDAKLVGEAAELKKLITPKAGERFVGYMNGSDEWKADAELTDGLTLTIKFEKLPANPETLDNVSSYIYMMALAILMTIASIFVGKKINE